MKKLILALLLLPTICLASVKVYTQPQCGACDEAKQYLRSHGIKYYNCDISVNKQCQEEFERKGYSGTPTFEINGKVIQGYSPTELARVLGR